MAEFERFLTEGEKVEEVSAWLKKRSNPLPSDVRGGQGHPDRDMFPWTDRLNQIRGVCTIQSCAGHSLHGGNIMESTGNLWIRVSEPMWKRFLWAVPYLAANPLIDRLRLMFLHGRGDIIDINFQGNERGQLAESMGIICEFFERLQEAETPTGDHAHG